MKAGRYFNGSEIRPLLVDSKERILDWSAFDNRQASREVRTAAMAAVWSGSDMDFLTALPRIEEWLAANPGFGEKIHHSAVLPAEILKLPMPPPVRPRKLICVGLNYRDHARESKMELPSRPLLFAKTSNAVNGHNHVVHVPRCCEQLDFEAELAVVIGKTCRSVRAANAMSCVAGFTCTNDISARDFQFTDGQWFRGKSCDGFAPLGPCLVTRAAVPDHRALSVRCRLNGQVMQDSTTENLVFDVPALVEFISGFITLEPGDVIATGTPPGVGFARKPPLYLRDGDRVEVEIENVGLLCNKIQRDGAPHD